MSIKQAIKQCDNQSHWHIHHRQVTGSDELTHHDDHRTRPKEVDACRPRSLPLPGIGMARWRSGSLLNSTPWGKHGVRGEASYAEAKARYHACSTGAAQEGFAES